MILERCGMKVHPRAAWPSKLLALFVLIAPGCSGPILRPQSPEAVLQDDKLPDANFVSEFTHPYGTNYVKAEAVALITGLAGTGEDPPPTANRVALLTEMSRRQVENPNRLLASPNTALVLLRGYLRPGIREGDRFDIEVRVPRQSEITSLRDGWLLPTRLSEHASISGRVCKGKDLALAKGPLLVDPSADSEAIATRGRVLSGGIALKSRPLGLIIDHAHQSARMSQSLSNAINRRFHLYVNGRKQGVATPKNEEFVELSIHPRYKDNVSRYLAVIRNIAINQSASDANLRMPLLERQLKDPLTSSTAALRLEALGAESSTEVLLKGVKSKDPEVQLYSAEALAYLDHTDAVEALANAARNEPAFRANALAALSTMNDVDSYDALRDMLSVQSTETRYGAFRSLWAMDEDAAIVRGEPLDGQFNLHVLDVGGPPLIHVTKSFRPEIVLFGKSHQFQLPLVLDAGSKILVNGLSGGQITVSKFEPGKSPEKRVVSTDVEEVVRTIVDMGGTYPDVVQALQQAKHEGALASRFRVDALPEPGRRYDRNGDKPDEVAQTGPSRDVASPLPNLFSRRR